jgi:UvrD/REP helicase N-terminal domain
VAQLGIGVEFLHEFGKLEPSVRRRTVEAVEKFSAHTHAGLHLEKLTNPRDARVRTIRIDQFWRGVVLAPERGDQYVLLRVLPHDDAIDWARSRTFSVNPVSGILEVRDVVALEELTGPAPAPTEPDRLFAKVGDADLRRLGIDDQVLAAARRIIDEAMLEAFTPLMPESQADVLQALAAGYDVEQVWADVVAPRVPAEAVDTEDLAAAVERTQGRIALVDGPDELLALLAKPLALWRVFLHPSQEEVAYRPTYWGSAQVTGGPGTGKTVVALHRVKHLVTSRDLPPKSVLLTTYTRGLAEALERDLTQLLDPEQRRAVEVLNVDRWALGVVRSEHGHVTVKRDDELLDRLASGPFPPAFLMEEWRQVVLANAVHTEEEYLGAPRRGRGRGLTKGQKRQVWATLAPFTEGLRRERIWTFLTLADEAAQVVAARRSVTWSSTRSRTCTPRSGGCCAPRSRSARTTCSSRVTPTSASTATTSACAPSASVSPAGRAGCGSTTGRVRRSCAGPWGCSATSPSPTSTTDSTRSPGTAPRCTARPRSSDRRRARLRKPRIWRSRCCSGTRTGWPGATSRWSHAPGASRSGWRASCTRTASVRRN